MLSAHKVGGKTNSETIDLQWRASGKRVDINWEEFIDSTLQSKRVIENLQMLTPRHRENVNLKNGLAKYKRIKDEGGWNRFSSLLPKIGKGMRYPEVAILRNRLSITQGHIEFDPEDPELFDQSLHEHVMLFQSM